MDHFKELNGILTSTFNMQNLEPVKPTPTGQALSQPLTEINEAPTTNTQMEQKQPVKENEQLPPSPTKDAPNYKEMYEASLRRMDELKKEGMRRDDEQRKMMSMSTEEDQQPPKQPVIRKSRMGTFYNPAIQYSEDALSRLREAPDPMPARRKVSWKEQHTTPSTYTRTQRDVLLRLNAAAHQKQLNQLAEVSKRKPRNRGWIMNFDEEDSFSQRPSKYAKATPKHIGSIQYDKEEAVEADGLMSQRRGNDASGHRGPDMSKASNQLAAAVYGFVKQRHNGGRRGHATAATGRK